MKFHSDISVVYLDILFAVWQVAAVDEDVLSGSWNGLKNAPAPILAPDLDSSSALSLGGAQCVTKGHDHMGRDRVWHCGGYDLFTVPANLTFTSDPMGLALDNAGIKVLRDDSLTPYAEILKDLYLTNVPEFHTFESNIFRHTTKLQTIYIEGAPKLTHINNEVFSVHLPQLERIRILKTSLLSLPYFGNLVTDNILKTVDLENNQIRTICTASIKITSEELFLNYNKITSVGSRAFNGSRIGRLSMKGNRALTTIHEDAFVGLASIRRLDLSETSITALPTNGLQNLDELNIQNTSTLMTFPSIYKLTSITKAYLTYPCHCCALKFPAKHDPEQHKRYEELKVEIEKNCSSRRRSRGAGSYGSSYQENYVRGNDDDIGTFHNAVITPSTRIHSFCGSITVAFKNITCYPEPDAFNPCEDIMGYWGLRIAVWFVAILTLFGNLAVLTVLVLPKANITVPKFLMCNLALADFFMGIYLTLIAGMDARSIGEYFNYAIDWQSGLGCKVAGFLTVFSTELSIFTLTIMTGERWYSIVYAIHLNRRLKLKTCAQIMAAGWMYACVMAALPLTGISGYARTSICLPLEDRNTNDLVYLVTLLVFNGFALALIVIGYGCMYTSIRSGRAEVAPVARSADKIIAKRMAFLVVVDFACWAPIAFFGVMALVGRPLIDVSQTKILLVFVYPLNSCANPYMYALLTRQYRRDLLNLLARNGMCVERAMAVRYKDATGVLPCAATAGRIKHSDARSKCEMSDLQPCSVTAPTMTNPEISARNTRCASGRTANHSSNAVQKLRVNRAMRKARADIPCCQLGAGTEEDSGQPTS